MVLIPWQRDIMTSMYFDTRQICPNPPAEGVGDVCTVSFSIKWQQLKRQRQRIANGIPGEKVTNY